MAGRIKKAFILVTGFLTCPCHLPFVLPALAAGLAGTTLGAFISENTGLLIALATAYFVGGVFYFLCLNRSSGREQSSDSPERLHERVGKRELCPNTIGRSGVSRILIQSLSCGK